MTNTLPFSFAKKHQLVIEEQTLYISNSSDLAVAQEAQRHCGYPLRLIQLDDDEITQKMEQLYQMSAGASTTLAEQVDSELHGLQLSDVLPQVEELLEDDCGAPVIKLINTLIAEAIQDKASDIHIDYREDSVIIRLRKDGMLSQLTAAKKQLGPVLVSRIKVMAKLDITEHRLPQDGRMTIHLAGRPIDIRVSIIPSGSNERVVMRILDRMQQQLDLRSLGMADKLLSKSRDIINRTHGIVLVTGPTGSGKTTTLYAALQHINCAQRNVMTIEDPIEYDLPDVSQTAVNELTGLTFSKGLRSILRQDPDVILVGEIRDLETAKIAIQASQTGHLVFATLHTNSAISAITRLRDMGIPSYLLASSLVAVISQRLVRQLCDHCKSPSPQQPNEWIATGCQHCDHSGYIGRTGLFELLEIDVLTKQAIHDDQSEQALADAAKGHFYPMNLSGRDKISQAITSADEVARMCRE